MAKRSGASSTSDFLMVMDDANNIYLVPADAIGAPIRNSSISTGKLKTFLNTKSAGVRPLKGGAFICIPLDDFIKAAQNARL